MVRVPDVVTFHQLVPSRAQRVLPWAQGALALAQLGLGVRGPFPQPWWSLLWVSLLLLAVLQAVSVRRVGTELSPQGFRVHHGLARGRGVGWAEVGAVRPPQRFEQHTSAVLLDGRVIKLLGVSRDSTDALLPRDRTPETRESVRGALGTEVSRPGAAAGPG